MTFIAAFLVLVLCAGAMYYAFDFLPEQERREGALRLLTSSIEVCFSEVAPGDHLGIGEEIFMTHKCREDDDLNELCMEALRFAQRTADYVHEDAPIRYRLYWCTRPRFTICTDRGIRKTCCLMRFFLRPVTEDPHQ